MDFLENNDYNVNNAVKQCFDTLEWRLKFGVNGKEIYLNIQSKLSWRSRAEL